MKQFILKFYNIKFYNYSFDKILLELNKKKGYLVAPAASTLIELKKNKYYFKSLLNSRIAIFDSGFFCLLILIFKGIRVKKNSGFLFLKKFLNNNEVKKEKIFLINPNKKESFINKKFLNSREFYNVKNYIAPVYKNNFHDMKLFKKIKKYNPKYILINIGGLKQELLAYEIEKKFPNKYVTLCLGAAIAFMTGSQAPINNLIDKIYLGWFCRLIYNPKIYFLRTFKSFNLITFFLNKNVRDKIKIIKSIPNTAKLVSNIDLNTKNATKKILI